MRIHFFEEQVWTQTVGDNALTVNFDTAINIKDDLLILKLKGQTVITIKGSDVKPFFKWMLETRLDELKAVA
jgi:hypothetical protein